jgi:Zn finger protein HypA/HybF involved in hydrogenase expression
MTWVDNKNYKYERDKKQIMECWHCRTELIWGGDHDIDEEEESEYLIVTNLSCPKCRSYFEVYYPKETDETN